MVTTRYKVFVREAGGQTEYVSALLDEILSKVCEKTGLHPQAVLMAALVLLVQRDG